MTRLNPATRNDVQHRDPCSAVKLLHLCKVQNWKNPCLGVHNLQRNILALPRTGFSQSSRFCTSQNQTSRLRSCILVSKKLKKKKKCYTAFLGLVAAFQISPTVLRIWGSVLRSGKSPVGSSHLLHIELGVEEHFLASSAVNMALGFQFCILLLCRYSREDLGSSKRSLLSLSPENSVCWTRHNMCFSGDSERDLAQVKERGKEGGNERRNLRRQVGDWL